MPDPSEQTTDLADLVITELAERYSTKLLRNPAWNRREERAAWAADQEYAIPEYIERPIEDRRRDSCMTVDEHADGERFIRALSYTEIGDVVRAVLNRTKGGPA